MQTDTKILPKIFTSRNGITIFFVFLLIVLATLEILLGLLPPHSRDALIHHLCLPKLVLEGRLDQVSDMPYFHFPQTIQILYGFCIWLGVDWMSHWVHMVFAWATGFLIYKFLKREGEVGSIWIWFGVVFFLSLPIIFRLSVIAYVDLALIFFSTAALFQFIFWYESGYERKHALWAGLFCGLAVGTKYNGLLVLAILVFFFLWMVEQERKQGGEFRKVLRGGLFFIGTALLIGSPWYVKNMIEMGNPIYPMFNSLFGVESDMPEVVHSIPHLIYRHVGYGEPVWKIVLLPLRIFFEGQDDVAQYFDGVLNPFLLLLALPSLFFLRSSRRVRFLWGFILLYFLMAMFMTGMRIRYILPIVPPILVLCVYSLQRLDS
ncbi:MAG: ArnT family glycosyltransferase, partial [Desulfovibrionales bacterium]